MMVAVMVVSSVVVGQAAAAPVGTDDVVTVGEAAAALADVASVTGPSAVTVASSEGFTAAAAGSVVELPKDPTDGLSLTTADGASIEIGLPGAANADDGVRQASGEVVYADALPDVAVAAQPTPDGGMRALVVIDGPQAPTEFRFPMTVPAGASLVPSPDGGVSVIGSDGAPVGQIAAPWAYDANGTAVPTSYRVEGTTLIQTVAHVGTAYPVVADPSFSVGWTGLFVRWSRSEALRLTGLTLAMTGTAVGAMCAGPHIVLCAAAVGGIWYVTHSLTDWAVGKLYDRGCRLETRIVPFTSTYVKC
jgi:hypothetical protein